MKKLLQGLLDGAGLVLVLFGLVAAAIVLVVLWRELMLMFAR